jgi:hypothetical protein
MWLVATAMILGCGGVDPQEARGSAGDLISVEERPLRHPKCPPGTFRCDKVCCDASGDVACVKGVCCVPPHCP